MKEAQNEMKHFDSMPDILTAEIIAAYMGIGYVKALNLIKYGGIPYKKIGSVYRVHKKVFEKWLMEPKSEVINF